MSVVYGPVPSWRLGRSLGIYAVSSLHKTCSSDCLHSQPWLTTRPLCERRIFVSAQALRSELVEMEGLNIDFVTFSSRHIDKLFADA
jgi:wyosine [tRNA(Phe)-imidazoG37] synthetase (radical SAM superfamily)